jgi:MFS transporter, SP family, galactose:H+ symporter
VIGPLLRIGSVTAAFGLLFGFSTAIIAGVLEPVVEAFSLTAEQAGVTVAVLVVSCFFGAIAAGPISARIGRRPSLALASLLAAAGYALVVVDAGYWGFFTARIVIGLAVGLSAMVAPMFAGEASPVRFRGAVVSLFQLAVTLGMLLAYALPLILGTADWQLVVGCGLGVAALCGATLFGVPESPYWLALKGDDARAARAAAILRTVPPRATDLSQPAAPAGPGLFDRRLRGVLTLCCVLFILQNLSGIDGVLYYAPHIFTELGLPAGTAALLATAGLGAVNVAATIFALSCIDRLGRRILLLSGSAVMTIGLALAILADLIAMPMLGLAGLSIFIAAFAISLGPIPYVLMSELFPASVRERGIAAASATSWLFNAFVAASFLSGVELIGLSGVLALFGTVCGLSLVISWRYVPETRGKTLEALEANVLAGVPLRNLGSDNPNG